MNKEYAVYLDHVDKLFMTRHMLAKDDATGKRSWWSKKRVHAVKDVTFGVRKGEVFGLLGPNGAGKTTTVKMISALVRPGKGKVYIEQMHVERKRLKVLQKIGVVLEGERTCIWPLTPLENLAYFGNLKNVTGKTLKERSNRLLEFIGLAEKKNVQVRRMSRGQKQKLAVCIALIADPPVLLLDEPTTGLDVQSARAIKDKIIEMAHEMGKSVLVTTHDMSVAQQLCDRIGIINKGELVTCKRTDELLEVFTDQTYELRLDRAPEAGLLDGIHGLVHAASEAGDEGSLLIIQCAEDEADRSEALYTIMERLRGQGITLRNITHRKQTLENVFLNLTTDSTGIQNIIEPERKEVEAGA
ncbi:MAG: ABC transporter ATP-binding protein [Candidatus Hydrogenedentes bacterium]|nr:ABC transporter ATP-binding protein [Candidatus Hydrogenedentota bacterium]